jgi:hypothetical protein
MQMSAGSKKIRPLQTNAAPPTISEIPKDSMSAIQSDILALPMGGATLASAARYDCLVRWRASDPYQAQQP